MTNPIIRRRKEIPVVSAQDGAKVREFFGERDQCAGISLADGYLPPGRRAISHIHKVCDEFYVVTSGKGVIHLNGEAHPIEKGDQIFIPHGVVHALENSANDPLEIVCISSPPYRLSDYYSYAPS